MRELPSVQEPGRSVERRRNARAVVRPAGCRRRGVNIPIGDATRNPGSDGRARSNDLPSRSYTLSRGSKSCEIPYLPAKVQNVSLLEIYNCSIPRPALQGLPNGRPSLLTNASNLQFPSPSQSICLGTPQVTCAKSASQSMHRFVLARCQPSSGKIKVSAGKRPSLLDNSRRVPTPLGALSANP